MELRINSETGERRTGEVYRSQWQTTKCLGYMLGWEGGGKSRKNQSLKRNVRNGIYSTAHIDEGILVSNTIPP